MLLLLLLSTVAAPPTPLDAFRANFANMKAEMDYEICGGRLNMPIYKVWSEGKRQFSELPETKLLGRWACDGQVELYWFTSTEELLGEARKEKHRVEAGKVYVKTTFVPRTEVLWDGKLLASHDQMDSFFGAGSLFSWQNISVRPADKMAGPLGWWRGPFTWALDNTFPYYIDTGFPGIVPTRKRAVLGGHPVEVEVYTREPADGGPLTKFEVAYDPSIGYLPRFVRCLWLDKRDQTYMSRELYLAEARPCAAGGFVPTEWYSTTVVGDRFETYFPKYDVDTLLFKPGENPVGGTRFRATSFKSLSGPAAMTDLKGVRTLAAAGGWVPLGKRARLSLPEIKKALGNYLTDSQHSRVLPTLDVTELRAFEPATGPRSTGAWKAVLAFAVLLAVAGLGLWRIRRRSVLGALLAAVMLTSGPGCGEVGTPVIKLNAAFKDICVFAEPRQRDLEMLLIARNDGNRPLRIFKADGGCTCRKIDQTSLPRALKPGEMIGLSLRMGVPAMSGPQSVGIHFETDQGVLSAGVPYFLLVSHEFNPDSISRTALHEGEKWSFDLTHRAVYREGGPRPSCKPHFPPEFSVVDTSRRGGKVAAVPGFAYEDTVYRLSLNDLGFGLRKDVISLCGAEKEHIAEVPLVWERVPFLSSVPARVSLGARAVRLFLRCEDDSVELTRIRSRPKGVDAVIVSPREVRVSLSRGAAPIIDGTLEVETSSPTHDALRVPVVRFSSTDGGGARGHDRS